MAVLGTIAARKKIESVDNNDIRNTINGSTANDVRVIGTTEFRSITATPTSATVLMRSNTESLLVNLGLQGESSYRHLALIGGAAAPIAANSTPAAIFQDIVKPNATAGLTATSFYFHTRRDGSNTALDGNAWAYYPVCSFLLDNSTFQAGSTLGATHDGVAITGIAVSADSTSNGAGNSLGGTVNSYGRPFGGHFVAESMHVNSPAAVAVEVNVSNSTGTTAREDGVSATGWVGYGYHAISQINRSIAGRASSLYSTAGLRISANDESTYNGSFRWGIVFGVKSFLNGGIDFAGSGTTQLTAASKTAIRLHNLGPIVFRNAAGTGDIPLFYGNASDVTILQYLDTQVLSINAYHLADGTSREMLRVDIGGALDFRNAQIAAPQAGATAITIPNVTLSGSGTQPTVAAATDWLIVRKAGSVRYIPAWT